MAGTSGSTTGKPFNWESCRTWTSNNSSRTFSLTTQRNKFNNPIRRASRQLPFKGTAGRRGIFSGKCLTWSRMWSMKSRRRTRNRPWLSLNHRRKGRLTNSGGRAKLWMRTRRKSKRKKRMGKEWKREAGYAPTQAYWNNANELNEMKKTNISLKYYYIDMILL